MFNRGGLPWASPFEVELDVAQAVRLRRVARSYVTRQRRKKGRAWNPRWSCAWFSELTMIDTLRAVKTIKGLAP